MLPLVDLRHVDSRQLEPLLAEETAEWQTELDWDFSGAAHQIRRLAGPRALAGVALMDKGEVAGYGYTVVEYPKGLIGDVYVRPGWRGAETETRLFKVLLDALTGMDGVERVESQLMLTPPRDVRGLTSERFIQLFERRLLMRELRVPVGPAGMNAEERFRFTGWEPAVWDSLPRLIMRSYEGHIDGQINDQYATVDGAEKFLRSLLDNAGCGEFFRPGSLFAIDRRTEWMSGAILTSLVTPETAHVTQLCVVPEMQGSGLGRELLRRSLAALAVCGVKRVTLTVTASNTKANRIYDTSGFSEMRRFCAIVWSAAGRVSNSRWA